MNFNVVSINFVALISASFRTGDISKLVESFTSERASPRSTLSVSWL